MTKFQQQRLSRRERQIMDIIFEQGQATAAQVLEALPDPPSYSSVRALLRILEEKGHVRHMVEGQRYVFLPTQPRQNAARSAMRQLVRTFFGGSVEAAVATLLSDSDTRLSEAELARLASLIEQGAKLVEPSDGSAQAVSACAGGTEGDKSC